MKYIWCLLMFVLISQASAQLRCIRCTNCANLPANPQLETCAHPPPGGTTTSAGTTTSSSPTPQAPPSLTPRPNPQDPTNPTPPGTPVTPPSNPILTPPTNVPGDNTQAPTEAPTTTTIDPNVPNLTPGLLKLSHRTEIEELAAHFSCFRVRVSAGTGQTQVNRGCVANSGSTNRTCWRSTDDLLEPQDCQLCWNNECNSTSGLYSSLFLAVSLVAIVLQMF